MFFKIQKYQPTHLLHKTACNLSSRQSLDVIVLIKSGLTCATQKVLVQPFAIFVTLGSVLLFPCPFFHIELKTIQESCMVDMFVKGSTYEKG